MPDNFIQQPENTQNYNRYAYVLNNPLMYTDPSGELFGSDLALLGAISANPVTFGVGAAIMLGSVLAANWDKWGVKDFFNNNVSNAVKDGTRWIGNQFKSVGKFFSNLFKKSSRYEVSNVTSLNYAAVNTTNTISNSFTAGSTASSGGFKSNYRGNGADIKLNNYSQSAKNSSFFYNAVDNMVFNNGSIMKKNDFYFTFNEDINANATFEGIKNGKYHVNFDIGDYEETIPNIRALVIHEAYGHGFKNYGDDKKNHYKAYQASIDSKYWQSTTYAFKHHTVTQMWKYFYREVGYKPMPKKYMDEYEKYNKPRN